MQREVFFSRVNFTVDNKRLFWNVGGSVSGRSQSSITSLRVDWSCLQSTDLCVGGEEEGSDLKAEEK